MSITTSDIENLAPDQASLKAASKLMKTSKWPLLAKEKSENGLVWGECQGSGANPYRTVVNIDDHGYKCTCPSRKFPCKHALALMWMYAEGQHTFIPTESPDWVNDWVGRRRKGTQKNEGEANKDKGKNIHLATKEEAKKVIDPKAEARKKAAAEKREQNKKVAITTVLEELESWLADQLEVGISNLHRELMDRCRKIAARLVDGKAGALASRLDELPSRILDLPTPLQVDALLCELGQLKLLIEAWRKQQKDPEVYRSIANAETKQTLIDTADTPKAKATWEVLCERIRTRRDGLVEQATWLMRLDGDKSMPPFALLLDFFPASIGKRSEVHIIGDQFVAELAFYPARFPLRAIIVERQASAEHALPWQTTDTKENILGPYRKRLAYTPWMYGVPLKLGAGRLVKDENKNTWWCSNQADQRPLLVDGSTLSSLSFGLVFFEIIALWDGFRLQLLAGQSQLGRITFHD